MATKLKVRFEPKGDKMMAIPLFANGRPVPFGMPIESRKMNTLLQTLTKAPVEFIPEALPPTRGPGRPRKTPLAGTAMASMGGGARMTGTSAGGRTRTGNGKAGTQAAPRPRGRPRRTPIS